MLFRQFLRRASRLVVPAALAASAVGWPMAARAADSVAFDAALSVSFTEAAAGYDPAGASLAGAQVTVVARLGDAEPAIQSLSATTGPGGLATFAGVARATGDTPVLLFIEAERTVSAPIGGCTVTETHYDSVDGVVSEPLVALDLVGFLSSSTACPPGGPVPPGVVADGTVHVTVVGSRTAIPLPGIVVTLTAAADGVPFQALAVTTGDDGRATVDGVGRPAGDALVTLVAAVTDTTTTGIDGCTASHHWSGSGRAAGAAGAVEIVVPAELVTTIACPPPGPGAPVLAGMIHDPSGEAVTVATAWLAMTRSDGARWIGRIEPAADGSFAARLQAWGSDDDPAALEIHVLGAPTGTREVGDCIYADGPLGSLSLQVALEAGFDPDPVTIVTEIGGLSSVCGAVATPAPTEPPTGGPAASEDPAPGGASAPVGGSAQLGGPSITLPPTDAAAMLERPGGAPFLPALVGALVAVALLVGWTAARRAA